MICQVSGITNRNDAEKIVKTVLYCKREDLPNLKRDEFYISDLKGMQVVDSDHQEIGIVADILNFGAGERRNLRVFSLDGLQLLSESLRPDSSRCAVITELFRSSLTVKRQRDGKWTSKM